jgi:hypothetical protein
MQIQFCCHSEESILIATSLCFKSFTQAHEIIRILSYSLGGFILLLIAKSYAFLTLLFFWFWFQVMLDTVGPELQVINKKENPISLQEDSFVVLTPDLDKEATSCLLPINFTGLSTVSTFFTCCLDWFWFHLAFASMFFKFVQLL